MCSTAHIYVDHLPILHTIGSILCLLIGIFNELGIMCNNTQLQFGSIKL